MPLEAKPHCGQLVWGDQGKSAMHATQMAWLLASDDAHNRQCCLKIARLKIPVFNLKFNR